MKLKLTLLLLAAMGLGALMLTGCGGDNAPTKPAVRLLIFSTPWCESCKLELPAALKAISGNLTVQPTVYIETGSKPFDPPSLELAMKYQTVLGLNCEVLPDPWRWTTYRRYFGNDHAMVPAAVAVDAEGIAIKTFGPGRIAVAIEGFFN